MLAARQLEVEGKDAILAELSSIGLRLLAEMQKKFSQECAHQAEDTSRRLLLVCVLDKVEQTLSGLARPGNNRVGDFGLLAA